MKRTSVSVYNYMKALCTCHSVSLLHLVLIMTTDRTSDQSLAVWNKKPLICQGCAALLSSCVHVHALSPTHTQNTTLLPFRRLPALLLQTPSLRGHVAPCCVQLFSMFSMVIELNMHMNKEVIAMDEWTDGPEGRSTAPQGRVGLLVRPVWTGLMRRAPQSEGCCRSLTLTVATAACH